MILHKGSCFIVFIKQVGENAYKAFNRSLQEWYTTVLRAKSDSDVLFSLQPYQGLMIDKSLMY